MNRNWNIFMSCRVLNTPSVLTGKSLAIHTSVFYSWPRELNDLGNEAGVELESFDTFLHERVSESNSGSNRVDNAVNKGFIDTS